MARDSSAYMAREALVLRARAQMMRESHSLLARVVGTVLAAIYRVVSLYVLGMDIPTSTQIDPRVIVYHTRGLVIDPAAVIGQGVKLRQSTTIGSLVENGPAPIIGEFADIGANAVILGGVSIGARSRVGAGAVVLANVPPGRTAVGNPARLLPLRRGVVGVEDRKT